MTPILKAIVEAMIGELERQDVVNGRANYVDAENPRNATVDGHFDLEKVVRAGLAALHTPSEAILAAVGDGDTPFVARRNKANPRGEQHELICMTNADWRDTVGDDKDQDVLGRFATYAELHQAHADAVVRWRWARVLDAILKDTP